MKKLNIIVNIQMPIIAKKELIINLSKLY